MTTFPFTRPVGERVRLTADLTVTIGAVVPVELHPSGVRFDGPAVVVSAFNGSGVPSVPMMRVVSLSDPNRRAVLKRAVSC